MNEINKRKKIILVSIFMAICVVLTLSFSAKIASAVQKSVDFNFDGIESQIVDAQTPYNYAKDGYKLDFYGQVNSSSPESDLESSSQASPDDATVASTEASTENTSTPVDDSSKTTISSNGFAFHEVSTLPNKGYQNYIKINPFKQDSQFSFWYKPFNDTDNLQLVLRKASLDGDSIQFTITPTPDEAGHVKYTASVNNPLKANTTYYLLLENPNSQPCSGMTLTGLTMYYDDGITPTPNSPKALAANSGTPNAAVSIGNSGYPYCALFSSSSSSISITFDLFSGVYNQVYWETAVSQSGNMYPVDSWDKVIGSDGQKILALNPPTDNQWYRVVLVTEGGLVRSEPVQTVKLTNNSATRWFVGNGFVATNSNTTMNSFDVMGRRGTGSSYFYNSYNSNGTLMRTYEGNYVDGKTGIPTSLSSECNMAAVKFSFRKDMPYAVNTTFAVGKNVKALSIDQDTKIGTVDSAMFRVYLNPKTQELQQLQLVEKRSGEVLDEDYAYVMSFSDPPNRFWVGGYGDRTSGTNAWNFNIYKETSTNYHVATVSAPDLKEPVPYVVVGLDNTDSGFSLCWYNVQAGTDIGMDNGMGQVSDTGAIKLEVSATSSTEIAVKNTTGKYFSLYSIDDSGMETKVSSASTKSGDTFYYTGLKPDQKYRVKRSDDISVSSNVKYQDVYTYIDPSKKADHTTNVGIKGTGDSIVLTNAESTYLYCIKDASGHVVSAWQAPESGTVTLGGLSEQTAYKLYAKGPINSKSSGYDVKTSIKIVNNVLSSSSIRVENKTGWEYKLSKLDGTVISSYRTYTGETFTYSGLASDTQYTIDARQSSSTAAANALTWIDPFKTKSQNQIKYVASDTQIQLLGANEGDGYVWQLYDNDSLVYEKMASTTGAVTFDNLTANKSYNLIVTLKRNPNSETRTVKTAPALTTTPTSNHAFKFDLGTSSYSSYQYAIFPKNSSTPVSGFDWKTATSKEISLNSTNFKSDTIYTVRTKTDNTQQASWMQEKDVRTYIDPDKKSGDSETVTYYYANNRVMLYNADPTYKYGISTSSTATPSSYVAPVNTEVTLGGSLSPSTTYYVSAIRADETNKNSIRKTVKTDSDFTVTAKSDSSIQLSGSSSHEYCIYEDGAIKGSWTTSTSQLFENLNYSDKVYTIYQRQNTTLKPNDPKYYTSHTCRTYIDPERKSDGKSKITIYRTINKIVLVNTDSKYSYAVYTGASPSTWKQGTGFSYLIFDGLNANTTYNLKAKYTGQNENSVVKTYTTFKELTLTASSSSAFSFGGYGNFTYEVYDNNSKLIKTQSLSTDTTVSLSNLEFSDSDYTVRSHPNGVPTEIYDVRTVHTYIDPERKSDGKTKITVFTNINKITLSGTDTNYSYCIYKEGSTPSTWKNGSSSNDVIFDGLNDNSVYNLIAKRGDYTNSEVKSYTTHKDYTVNCSSSNEITIKTNAGYSYALFIEEQTSPVVNWASYGDDEHTYKGLMADRKYTVKARLTVDDITDDKTKTTYIDPEKTYNQNKVTIYENLNTITLVGVETTYSYILYDGAKKTEISASGKTEVAFTGLNADKPYTLTAKSTSNENSEEVKLNTHKDFAVSAKSSSKIVVTGHEGYKYAIVEDNQIRKSEWKSPDAQTKEVAFDGLKYSDTQYTIYARTDDEDWIIQTKWYDKKLDNTWIDVMRKQGATETTTQIYKNINYITLENLDTNYYYALKSGDEIKCSYRKPNASKIIVFEGLDADIEYKLVASHSDGNENCDTEDVTTFKDFKPESQNASIIKFEGFAGFKYEIYCESGKILQTKELSTDGTVEFTNLPYSDKNYNIQSSYVPYNKPYYDVRSDRTYIDPARKSDGTSQVKMYQNINKITLRNSDTNYNYTLKDESGSYSKSKLGTGISDLIFDGLDANKKYYLTAANGSFTNSEVVELKTHLSFSVAANINTTIDISDASNQYDFSLYLGNEKVIGWKNASSPKFTYEKTDDNNRLRSDTEYTVKMKETGSDDFIPDEISVTTWIDVMRQHGVTETTTQIYKNINYITLENLDTNYYYALKSGDEIKCSYRKPSASKIIVFEGLDADIEYKLVASHSDDDENCDAENITTFKDFKPESQNASKIQFKGWKDFKYEIYVDTGEIIGEITATSDNQDIVFDNLTWSDKIYNIRSSYVPYNKPYYDVRSDRTYIDPAKKSDGTSRVKMYQNINKITLRNSDINYIYILKGGDKTFSNQGAGSNDLVFSGLDDNTGYKLTAVWYDGSFADSEVIDLKTHPSFGVEVTSSSSMTISDANTQYDFALFYASSPTLYPAINWKKATSDKIIYDKSDDTLRLKSDTDYIVKMKETGSDDFIPDEISVTTWIDVMRQQGSVGDTTQIYKNINYITFENLDNSYFYALKDASGIVGSYTKPSSQKIVFNNLDADTEYTLYGSHSATEENCDTASFTTFKDFKPESQNASTIKFSGYKDFKYEIYYEGGGILQTKELSTDGTVEFKDLPYSDRIYNIRSSYVPYNKPYYDVRSDRTYIDPLRQSDGTTIVTPYENIERISLTSADPSYTYHLVGKGESYDIEDSAKVVFDKLTPDKNYTLTATSENNDRSDSYEFTTHKDFTLDSDSSRSIKIDANVDYQYAVVEDGVIRDKEWKTATSNVVTFENLKYCDTEYTIYCRANDEEWVDKPEFYDQKKATTWIDVNRRQGVEYKTETIDIYENINYITLEGLDNNYYYTLDPDDSKTGYIQPTNGKIVFSNLNADKTYTLKASHTNQPERCDSHDITTFKDFSLTSTNSKTITFYGFKNFRYAIYWDDGVILQKKDATSDGNITFSDLPYSDRTYHVRSEYIPYEAKHYYDIRDTRTYIDPERKQDGEKVRVLKNFHSFTLRNADAAYEYGLSEASGGEVQKWITPDANYEVLFTDLTQNKDYYLSARNKDGFTSSEYHKFKTHMEYSLENVEPENSKIQLNSNPGYEYALYIRENGVDTLVRGYEQVSDTTHFYDGLHNDVEYVVKAHDPADGNEFIPDEHSIFTYILPLQTGWTLESKTTPVEHTALEVEDSPGVYKYQLMLDKVDPRYEYALFVPGGEQVTEYVKGSQSVLLSDDKIKPDTTYNLKARRIDTDKSIINGNSMEILLTTIGKDLGLYSPFSVSLHSELCKGYWYKLVEIDPASKKPIDLPDWNWWYQTEDVDDTTYTPLNNDTQYQLWCKKTDIDTINIATEYTRIDPWYKNHNELIDIISMANYITLQNVDPNYEYSLYTHKEGQPDELVYKDFKPTDDGKIHFSNDEEKGLPADTSYIIKAKNVGVTPHNELSDNVEVVTHAVRTLNVTGVNGHYSHTWEYQDDVTKYGGEAPSFVDSNVYTGASVTFTDNKFEVSFIDDFDVYHIFHRCQTNSMSGYEFDYWTYKGDRVESGDDFTIGDDDTIVDIVAHYRHLYSSTKLDSGTGHDHFNYDYAMTEVSREISTDVKDQNTEQSDPVVDPYEDEYTWVNTQYKFNGNTYTASYSDTSLDKDAMSTTVRAIPYTGYLFDHWELKVGGEWTPVDESTTYSVDDPDDCIQVKAFYRHDIVNTNVSGVNGHADFDWELKINDETTQGPTEVFNNDNTWVNTKYVFEGNKFTNNYEDIFGEIETLELTANAYDGYIFDHWLLNGSEIVEGQSYDVVANTNLPIVAVYRHDVVTTTFNGENGLENLDWKHTVKQAYPELDITEKGEDKEYVDDNTWTNTEIAFKGDKVTVSYEDKYKIDHAITEVQALPYDGYIFDHWIINEEEVDEEEPYVVESGTDVEITAYYRHELAQVTALGNNGHDNFDWIYKIDTKLEEDPKEPDVPLFAASKEEKTSTTGLVPEEKSGQEHDYTYDKIWENSVFTFTDNKFNIKYDDTFKTDYFTSEFVANKHDGYLFDFWTVNNEQVASGQEKSIKVNDIWNIEAHYKHDLGGMEVIGDFGHNNFAVISNGSKTEVSSGSAPKVSLNELWVNSTYKFEGDTLHINYQDSFGQDTAEYKITAQPVNGHMFTGWTVNNKAVAGTSENSISPGDSVKVVANYDYLNRACELPELHEFDDGEFSWWWLIILPFVIASGAGAGYYVWRKRKKSQQQIN